MNIKFFLIQKIRKLFALIFLLIFLMLFCDGAYAQSNILTVFSAERDCVFLSNFNFYNRCVVKPEFSELKTAKPSSARNQFSNSNTQSDKFIESLNFENKISYLFKCKTSGIIPAGFEIYRKPNDRTDPEVRDITMQAISDGGSFQPRQTIVLILYSGATYRFFVEIDGPGRVVWSGCDLSVYSNITFPTVEPINEYTNLIFKYLDERQKENQELAKASTLPAKWVVIQKLDGVWQTEISALKREISELRKELKILQNIPVGQRSKFEESRIIELDGEGGIIETKVLSMENLKNLKELTEAALPNTQRCSAQNISSSNQAFCLTEAENLREKISDGFENQLNEIRIILQFFSDERNRLQNQETEIAKTINEIIKRLETKIQELNDGGAT